MSDERKTAASPTETQPAPTREVVDAIVGYFRSLAPAARKDFETLADRDRRFGEDVTTERSERGEPAPGRP